MLRQRCGHCHTLLVEVTDEDLLPKSKELVCRGCGLVYVRKIRIPLSGEPYYLKKGQLE